MSALCAALTPQLSVVQLQTNSHILGARKCHELYRLALFWQIMGHMDVLPAIAKGFVIFFPMVVILFALASYFR